MNRNGGVIHLVKPGGPRCQSGRWLTTGGKVQQRGKQLPCQNRPKRGSVYCESCGLAAWARVTLGQQKKRQP
jgi:hypothetical protein